MEAFKTHTGRAMPVRRRDVDTDQIIPARYLTSVSQEGFGEGLFRGLRDSDANFPLNLKKFKGASIIIADDNFGCGSSREHAVWAVCGAGFKVVIGKSFADIFSNNSGKNGLLLVTLPENVIDKMLTDAESGEYKITVDLEAQKITLPDGVTHEFAYDPFRKRCMLDGLDDIDYILSKQSEINAFSKRREANTFYKTTQLIR